MSADGDIMTTTVTKTTIESNAYDNVVAYIDDRSIIADPRDPDGYSKRPFVYDVDPLAKSLNFGDFPYIIAEYPMVEYSSLSADGKTKNIAWKMSLTVRTARAGASQGTDGKGKQDMFNICDDLQNLFNSDTYKQQFALLNMFFMNLTKTDVSSPIIDQKYIHQSDYDLSFNTRLKVSD